VRALDVVGDINYTGNLLRNNSNMFENFFSSNISACNITCSNITIQGATMSLTVLAADLGTVSTSNITISQQSIMNNVTASNILLRTTDTVSNPSYTWIGDSNTGMYHHSNTTIGFSSAGLQRLLIGSNIMFTGRVCINSNVTSYPLYVGGSNTDDVSIMAEKDIAAFSDARYKTNLQTIKDALSNIDLITGYTYNWIDGGKRFAGVLAQDVQKVLPEVVSADPESGKLSVAYGNMVSFLIEAIKDVKRRVEKIESVVFNKE
jgi:hypothetical protein